MKNERALLPPRPKGQGFRNVCDYEPILLDECYWAYKNAFPIDFKNILNSWSGSHVKIDKRIETESCNVYADEMLFGEFQQVSPDLKI